MVPVFTANQSIQSCTGWCAGTRAADRGGAVCETLVSTAGPASAALPHALRGAFVDEPRWVDLRWLRDMNQVDQSNPRGSGGSKQFLTEFLGPADLMSHERMVVLATGQGKAAETATRFTCDRRR
jgi:hypothetical protein